MTPCDDNDDPSPAAVLARLWQDLQLPPAALGRISLTGADPILPSTFRVGTAAAVAIAASAGAAAALDDAANGRRQHVAVDLCDASLECRSERLITRDGQPIADAWDALAGAYPCADGWVRVHTNFAHHRDGLVRMLGCAPTRDAVAAALARWPGQRFEAEATAAGLVVAQVRSFADWDAHPHAAAVASAPLVEITRIADGPPRPLRGGSRPLSGLRVLEMTRIIAGPVAGRALAVHGADVLRVIGPGVPTIELFDIDTGRGKRAAHLDVATPQGRDRFLALAQQADVVLQTYRPGVMERYGLDNRTLATAAPGLVVAGLSAYGWSGPWAGKRGFDSLVQAATGFNHAEGAPAGTPKPLPMQILDHASGYLLAAGIVAARLRQAREGGSWQVRVFLARTGHWLRGLGRLPDGLAAPEPAAAVVAARMETGPSDYGLLSWPRHAARMDQTPPAWTRPAAPYGSAPPAWSDAP